MWQFYLPRLPFMTDFPTVAHTIPVYDIWFKGTWGAFGWTEVLFRNRVYLVLAALTVAGRDRAAATSCGARARAATAPSSRSSPSSRLSLRRRPALERVPHLKSGAGNFNQGRYLLPLVGIAGSCSRSRSDGCPRATARRRSAAVLAGLLVLQALSLGLVLERFYA